MSRATVKPGALRPGDTIGVVAPAAAVERASLERGVATLTAMGYRVKVSRHALDRAGILAGTDATRAGELAAFFADPEVKAIFAARGGYPEPALHFAEPRWAAERAELFTGYTQTYLERDLRDLASIDSLYDFQRLMRAAMSYGASERCVAFERIRAVALLDMQVREIRDEL